MHTYVYCSTIYNSKYLNLTQMHINDRFDKENVAQPGVVAHTCNPSTVGGRGGYTASAQEIETSLGNLARSLPLLKLQKLARCGGTHL